ncbi:MAG: DUF3108 domain-containing protein [Bacteroidetes bacterium]|nr:DUF3108 domain-containing protein [Bacteroidota bacterium]MBV6460270.1 hypothetical protein [Flavobacteriales bacterium]WKZ74638.1 MAG: DUF3108 domain-containing protein [Vicingaceae bacterium]MCL4815864.1 DUF3108 domain-containing protein [Flavobacteriales bacterium]NOG94945.1 DUF3108 domain-containing protein [Bacteroidota bacterium]
MKTKWLLISLPVAIVAIGTSAFKQQNRLDFAQTPQNDEVNKLRTINYAAFKPGEVLEYRLHYGVVDAGTARLEVKNSTLNVSGREVLHVVGTGQSRGAFDWFYKVRDRYETYMDAKGVFPWLFVRRVNEGGYKINQDYKFFQAQNKVDNGKGNTFEVPEGVQDMLSAFYYARTIDFSSAKVGDIYTIPAFVDDEVFPLKIKYGGIEKIKVGKEYFECMKFHPVVQQGRIFSKEDDLTAWITNDKNKIPVLAQAKVLVGSIKMEITKYEGVANPMAIVSKK